MALGPRQDYNARPEYETAMAGVGAGVQPESALGLPGVLRIHGRLYRALKGWALLLTPITAGLAIAAAGYAGATAQQCELNANGYSSTEYDLLHIACARQNWSVAILGGAVAAPFFVATIFALAQSFSWVFGGATRRARREAERVHAAARQWYADALIAEADYHRAEAIQKGFSRGGPPLASDAFRAARWNGGFSLAAATLASILIAIGLVVGLRLEAQASFFTGAIVAIPVTGAVAAVGVVCLRQAAAVGPAVGGLVDGPPAELRQVEEMALAAMNARARGAAPPARPTTVGGPAFQAYARSTGGGSAADPGFDQVARSLGIDAPKRRKRRA